MLFLDQLEVKEVVPEWNRKLKGYLSECLAEADALSTEERTPSKWISLGSVRLPKVLAAWVEALRNELLWCFELFRVVLD